MGSRDTPLFYAQKPSRGNLKWKCENKAITNIAKNRYMYNKKSISTTHMYIENTIYSIYNTYIE